MAKRANRRFILIGIRIVTTPPARNQGGFFRGTALWARRLITPCLRFATNLSRCIAIPTSGLVRPRTRFGAYLPARIQTLCRCRFFLATFKRLVWVGQITRSGSTIFIPRLLSTIRRAFLIRIIGTFPCCCSFLLATLERIRIAGSRSRAGILVCIITIRIARLIGIIGTFPARRCFFTANGISGTIDFSKGRSRLAI
jgi:hypothetical protein